MLPSQMSAMSRKTHFNLMTSVLRPERLRRAVMPAPRRGLGKGPQPAEAAHAPKHTAQSKGLPCLPSLHTLPLAD